MAVAAIYCRISQDRVGAGLGVHRQEEDCRALAARRGWDVAGVFVDNDLSAYAGKPRPGYEQLLAQVEARAVDVVIAWHPDRLHRSPVELERFIETVESAQVDVVTVSAGDRDLSTPTGRLHARIEGAVARHESEHKADRQRRKHLELARAGRPSGGGSRPFGYADDRVTIIPVEADAIRWMVGRVLEGAPIAAITREMNQRVPTVSGRPWRDLTIKNMLRSARIAGIREHHPKGGEVIRVPATWPAIITAEESAAVVAVLDERRRRAAEGERTARRYLLSRLAWCGKCGAMLSTGTSKAFGPRYSCVRPMGGCRGVTVQAVRVEAEVVARLLASVPELPSGEEPGHWQTEIARAEAAMADLEHRYHELGTIARVDYWAESDRLRRVLEQAQAGLGRARHLTAVPGGLADRWESMDFFARREAVRTSVKRVTVAPVGRGGNQWKPERVHVEWRH